MQAARGHLRRIAAGVLTVASLVALAPNSASADGACALPGRELLVDVSVHLVNGAVERVHGRGRWASARTTAHIRLWEIGPDRYCARVTAVGEFRTVAGDSPNGTGAIRAGLSGSMRSVWHAFFTQTDGGFTTDYSKPVGSLGEWDCLDAFVSDCLIDGLNTGYFEWGFTTIEGPFHETYVTDRNGRLTLTRAGATGDITGSVRD
jgi:hypothetical protein